MEGYSVTEAATILGVPTERVWELLARGVLAGTSEGEAGMRVYLQPRPAPAPAPIAPGQGWPNGNDEPREPERELSPFRELLTEFRNLTERYGQALLALGESRGEVATLRSRVDLLEARMDLRLPMSGFAAPTPSSPRPPAPVEPAVVPPEAASDEHGADEAEDEHDRPTRRRRSSQRRATESFAEALARAEDPTRSELPGASDVVTALAALRDDPDHAAGATATEAILPRELPAADLMPFADEGPEPVSAAAEPEPLSVAAAQPEPEPEPEVAAAEREPVPFEHLEPKPDLKVVAVEPEPVAVEPDLVADAQLDEQPEPEPDGAAEPEPEPQGVAAEPEPEPQGVAAEPEAEPRAVAAEPEAEPRAVAAEPEPVSVVQQETEPEAAAAEQEPIEAEQPDLEPETVAAEQPEQVADVTSAAGVAMPMAEAAPATGPDGPPEPEDVPEAAEPEREVAVAGVEVETESRPIGEEPKAEEVAVDREPVTADRDTTAAEVEPATHGPVAVEPIAWDRERYTVDIEEPDWFAGEEPHLSEQLAPGEVPGIESAPGPEAADAATALPEAAPSVSELTGPPSAAHRDEETMLWFGRQPTPPAAEPAEERPAADAEAADDGASEMEVAGSGQRAQMPGSQELEDALAALNGLGTEQSEPASMDSPDGPVEETAAEVWPRADTSAWTQPREASANQPAVTPASRAYRRLRRIFPG